MKPIKDMSQLELAAFVQTHLSNHGVQVILSGGSVVAFYSQEKYVSKDLDFINIGFVKRSRIEQIMAEIGFGESDRYFRHPESPFLIEFPPGPLKVGEQTVDSFNEVKFATGLLRLLTPTDCVKDRLAAYFYWADRQCLQQAIWVYQISDVDLGEVRRWASVEGKVKEFEEIKARFTKF